MDLDRTLARARRAELEAALGDFLHRYLEPAFGTLPKLEVELAVLRLLEDLRAIDPNHGIYDLVSDLKVTRSKARTLIYERELRRLSTNELDQKVRDLLKRPAILKDGNLFVLEVENPLVSDHLRSRVQKLGHLTDGSFSPSIVRLSLGAMAALIESYLDEQSKREVGRVLVQAGAPDTSFSGVLKAVLKRVAGKVANSSGEALIEAASDYVGPIVEGAAQQVAATATDLFERKNQGDA